MENKTFVTIEATVNAPIEKVWKTWNTPEDVMQWNNASPDWHSPRAENDLRPGGSFNYRMEAKDGSFGFDFGGIYDTVQQNELIEYTMGDNRTVSVQFTANGNTTHIKERFEPENMHPVDFQKSGWQAILDNFKKYAEQS